MLAGDPPVKKPHGSLSRRKTASNLPWKNAGERRFFRKFFKRSPRLYYAGLVILALIPVAAACFYDQTPDGFCPDVIRDRVLRDQVQKLWHAGRVVVLMRHTDRCERGEPCPGGRGLLPLGEQHAKLIGRGMHTLFNSDFELFSSKVGRASNTARLEFSRSPTEVPWLREDCVKDLQSRLQLPHEGDQVMVTHSTCLAALTNDQGVRLIPFGRGSIDYGLAVFLERTPDRGMPQLLGCAWPDDWSDVLNE